MLVVGYFFVDAIFPPRRGGSYQEAPPALIESLTPWADAHGLLPPWTSWWSEDDLTGLYPERTTRRRIESQAPKIPLGYLRSSVEVSLGWDRLPGRYLAFGETYTDERSDANARGWHTETMCGQHLHQLHHPGPIAERIVEFLDGIPPRDA